MENLAAGRGYDCFWQVAEGVILAGLVGRSHICYRGLEFVLVESKSMDEAAKHAPSCGFRIRW